MSWSTASPARPAKWTGQAGPHCPPQVVGNAPLSSGKVRPLTWLQQAAPGPQHCASPAAVPSMVGAFASQWPGLIAREQLSGQRRRGQPCSLGWLGLRQVASSPHMAPLTTLDGRTPSTASSGQGLCVPQCLPQAATQLQGWQLGSVPACALSGGPARTRPISTHLAHESRAISPWSPQLVPPCNCPSPPWSISLVPRWCHCSELVVSPNSKHPESQHVTFGRRVLEK